MNEASAQHALVSALKDLAISLGRTPGKREFTKLPGVTDYKITQCFGNYSTLVQAAGLAPSPNQTRSIRITDQIFETPIVKHLENHKPPERILLEPYPSMAIISDIHWPFHSQRVLDRFFRWIGEHKSSVVIINGDAWDCYSHGRFPRSHNIFTPKEEESLARKHNEEFWLEVKKQSPESKCFQMLGNHDVRPVKRMLEQLPTMEHWIADYFKALFTFDGVATIMDSREELMFGDIAVFHGYRSTLGEHRDFTGFNCVVGHTHKPGVVYKSMGLGHLPKWELNCGLAGDPTAKGLTYTPQKITGWTNSFGVVDPDGPRVIIA